MRAKQLGRSVVTFLLATVYRSRGDGSKVQRVFVKSERGRWQIARKSRIVRSKRCPESIEAARKLRTAAFIVD